MVRRLGMAAAALAVVAAAGCGDDRFELPNSWAERGNETVIIPQPGDPPLVPERPEPPAAIDCDSLDLLEGGANPLAPRGSLDGDGSEVSPLGSIQAALDLAQPGDTVLLAPGAYAEVARTVRDGTAAAPIAIAGPAEAVVQGIEVGHEHHLLCGITIAAPEAI